MINEDKIDKRYLIKEEIINISDGGEFEYAKELILKYGLTPKIGYDSYEADNTIRINSLLKEKVIQDVDNLIKLKKDHTKDELRLQKEKYLIENYDFLTKVLNPPITNFNYTYYDKENNYKQLENITPKDFFNKYCTLNLNDYICLGSNNTKPYYKQYRKINCGNIYLLSRPIYLNLPIEEIKPIVIKSLKDKKAVLFFSFDKNLCLLDTELFNYKDIYNINSLTKYQGLEYNVYTSSHAMTFVGVNTKITPLLWKVENSWGEETNKKYLTMSDNYFDKYVYKVIIDKKYLTTKQKQYLQSPIINILPTDTI